MRSLPRVPDPNVEIAEPRTGFVKRNWWDFFSDLRTALLNRVPVTGSVVFVAATTAAVTFATAEENNDYDVWFAASDNNYHWATSIATTGFTANAANSTSATVRYMIIRA